MAESTSPSRTSTGGDKESISPWLSTDAKVDEFVRLMRDSKTGVEIRDRSFLFSTYKSCFTGEDFINWCTRRGICSTKALAIQLGQSLYRKGIITGAASDGFKDGGSIFYLEGRPLLSGFLLTRADASAAWSAKWFVLRQEKLYMYTTAHDMKPEMSVPLEDAYVRLLREDVGKEFGFEVVTTEKIYQLIALSYFEMDRWLSNLGAIVRRGIGVEDAWIEAAELELEKRETERCEEWLEREEKRREELIREQQAHRESPRTAALPPHNHPHSGNYYPTPVLGSTPSLPLSAFIRAVDRPSSSLLHSSSGAAEEPSALSRSPDDMPIDMRSTTGGGMMNLMRRSKPIEAQAMRKFP